MFNNESGFTMPVVPAYGGGMGGSGGGFFGGDGIWAILLFALIFGIGGNGFGGGFGGFGNAALGYDFPWLLNGQQNIMENTNSGFRDQMLNDNITSIRDGVFGLSTQMCNGFAGVEQGASARQIANMQQAFNSQVATMQGFNGVQGQLADCCCENRLGIADLKYTVATENCADRAALSDGVRDIIASNTASTQRILDQMCQDKIDAKNEKIADLERQLTMANLASSPIGSTTENAAACVGGLF